MSHWLRRPGPELQKATKKEFMGLKIRPPGHQNGGRVCPNAARGSQKYAPEVTPRKMKGDRPLGPRKVAQGCPNIDRRSQKWSPRIARCKSDMLICMCTYMYIYIYIYISLYTYTYERLPASMIHDTQPPCTFFKGRRQCFAHQYRERKRNIDI